MSDWADQRAREWLIAMTATSVQYQHSSLAALLREQRAGYANAHMSAAEVQAMEQDRVLAEVRREVEEVREKWATYDALVPSASREILSRLEKLRGQLPRGTEQPDAEGGL
jgi:hypothetical protein